jgi:hypothetical protein
MKQRLLRLLLPHYPHLNNLPIEVPHQRGLAGYRIFRSFKRAESPNAPTSRKPTNSTLSFRGARTLPFARSQRAEESLLPRNSLVSLGMPRRWCSRGNGGPSPRHDKAAVRGLWGLFVGLWIPALPKDKDERHADPEDEEGWEEEQKCPVTMCQRKPNRLRAASPGPKGFLPHDSHGQNA